MVLSLARKQQAETVVWTAFEYSTGRVRLLPVVRRQGVYVVIYVEKFPLGGLRGYSAAPNLNPCWQGRGPRFYYPGTGQCITKKEGTVLDGALQPMAKHMTRATILTVPSLPT